MNKEVIYVNNEKKEAIRALKISRGQIDGIIKMIEDGRYCVDVSNQIIAAQSLLKRANMQILKQHINNCVVEAIEHDKGKEKIDEITELLSKIIDK